MKESQLTRRNFLKTAGVLASTAAISANESRIVNVVEGSSLHAESAAKKPVLRFVAISDTHFNASNRNSIKRNARALQVLSGKSKIDAVIVAGDVTDSGQNEQYDHLLECYKNPDNIDQSIPVYFLMGNHDHGVGVEKGIANYRNKLKQELDQYIVIKGYPFITISMRSGAQKDYEGEAHQFLKTHLAKAAKEFPRKPIFVFFHIPPMNTCYGSNGWGQDIFTPTLSRYPQAVVFAGHSHSAVGDPRSIWQGKFTSVNDGSIAYCEQDRYEGLSKTVPPNAGDVHEGIIVNVYSNHNIVMERWDVTRDEEMLPRWTVDAPHDGSKFHYNKLRALPEFADGAKVEIKTGDKSVEVTFPQAVCCDNGQGEAVFKYWVNITEADDHRRNVASQTIFSQYYLNSKTPKTLSASFTGLPADKPLTAVVIAVNSMNTLSLPLASDDFRFQA